MSYQFDIDIIQDYVEGLCTRHTEIKHNVDGIKSFARFQSGEQLSEIKKSAGKIVVVVAAINGRRVGDKDERMLQREMVLRVVVYAEKDGDVIAAKKAALKKAEEVMLDLWTEMERQQEEDLDANVCGVMHFLRPEEMAFEEVEDQPWLINHYGWDLVVPFRVYMPAHNPDKWNVP